METVLRRHSNTEWLHEEGMVVEHKAKHMSKEMINLLNCQRNFIKQKKTLIFDTN